MTINTYTFDGGMKLTPYGRIWFKTLLSGVNRTPVVSLQLGTYNWDKQLYQRVQQPVVTLSANALGQLIDNGDYQFTEAGLLDENGQTIAVTPLDVQMSNQTGLLEYLRWKVLIQPATSRMAEKLVSVSFQNSVCRLINGEMNCNDHATERPDYELSTADDEEWAEAPEGTQNVGELFDRAEPEDATPQSETSGPLEALEPTDSIYTTISFASRWGQRVKAGWKLPKTRLYAGAEPGFYLHILKTTRFLSHA